MISCDAIEAEAIALVEADEQALPPFLLLAQGHWHHGVIGIVAARLVEKYHRPTALLAGEGNGRMRASVRAPMGFAVDAALKQCDDLLARYGGHPAAGGFTVDAANVHALHAMLNNLAGTWLSQQGDGIPIQPDVPIRLADVSGDSGINSAVLSRSVLAMHNPSSGVGIVWSLTPGFSRVNICRSPSFRTTNADVPWRGDGRRISLYRSVVMLPFRSASTVGKGRIVFNSMSKPYGSTAAVSPCIEGSGTTLHEVLAAQG